MVFDALVENIGLHGGPEGDDFVGIQLDVRFCDRKNSFTVRRISGVRVAPPTSTTSSMSAGLNCASASACLTGPMVRSTTGPNEGVERTRA